MRKRPAFWLIILLTVLAIASCTSRHVAQKPDTTRPTIVSVSPAKGATAVAITTAVTIAFSEPMNPSTINDTSFLLVSVSSTTTTPVPGSVTYDASSNVATFMTTSALIHGTQYIATITTGVTDAAGNAINPSYSWSFVTIPAPGALDTSFGTGGRVGRALSSYGDDSAYAAAIQQDGKIVTAGLSTAATGTMFFTIARFQSGGALDTTFGFTQNGWSGDIVGTARAVELQSDGKIVAAGDTGALSLSNSDFLITRYNTNGTTDTTFGLQSNGTVTMDMYDHDVVRSLVLQEDGKIVVAGDGINSGSLNYASIIARFNADGTLDTSFADGGRRIDTIGTTSRAWVVKMQPDGMIVVGGNFQDGSGQAFFYLARYDSNGAPDNLFNSGMVTASPGADPVLSDIEILPNGKIIVVGTTNRSSGADLFGDVFLMGYNSDGTLDTTFGSTGTVITHMSLGNEMVTGLAVQADGRILVSATFHLSSGPILTSDFALLRYDADGALDTTFGGNGYGMVTTDFGIANNDLAYDVQIQQDGKIVVVGTAYNGSNYDLGLARYWP